MTRKVATGMPEAGSGWVLASLCQELAGKRMPTYYNCAPTHRPMYEFNAQPFGVLAGVNLSGRGQRCVCGRLVD